jgi:cyclopropane fatty-acyl-phospholipid synthase-like methyltransferase
MGLREQMDRIYKDVPLETIPWNITEPPQLLVDALQTGKIKPCKVVDLGCGAGNYSVWLAQQGFDVTGIDISEQAIEHAKRHALSEGVSCNFISTDLLGDMTKFNECFNLALDWEVLHHVFPEDRPGFIRNVHQVLVPDGIYISLCFHEDDPSFGGKSKFRDTPMGTKLYFSSEAELRELFTPLFKIDELIKVEIPGKYGSHIANLAWLKRK